MKNIRLILFVYFLVLLTGCSKQSDSKTETPPPYYVSGDYLCRDSTYHKTYLFPDSGDVIVSDYLRFDSTYIIHIDYVDTALNQIRFKSRERILDHNYSFHENRLSPNQDLNDTLSLRDNKLYYTYTGHIGFNQSGYQSGYFLYYTRITGTKIK